MVSTKFRVLMKPQCSLQGGRCTDTLYLLCFEPGGIPWQTEKLQSPKI
jgi:hypothetical protein